MVYDDDTYEPVHHDIGSGDRANVDISWVSHPIRNAVAQFATRYPNWTPEDIRDGIEETFAAEQGRSVAVPLDAVYAVLQAIGRSTR